MGANIDSSINFGMQNFFFVKKDETDGTYDYYGFQNSKGTILIMRTDKNIDNALYYQSKGVFSTIFAAKATFTYVSPVNLAPEKF
jgi:hypothetical protein